MPLEQQGKVTVRALRAWNRLLFEIHAVWLPALRQAAGTGSRRCADMKTIQEWAARAELG
ncbi:MAG: hypothetical protein U5L00_18885 [Desulfovermiculus sp.]|nr:hypothetical protein [Desulfovermiculus sp.]